MKTILTMLCALLAIFGTGCSKKPVVPMDYPSAIRIAEEGQVVDIEVSSKAGQYVVEEFKKKMPAVKLQAKLFLTEASLEAEMTKTIWLELKFEQSIYVSIGQKVEEKDDHLNKDGNDFRLMENISRIIWTRDGAYADLLFFVDNKGNVAVFEAPELLIPSVEGLKK